MGNMDIWEKVARPPKEALKTIKGGRLKGMTDISPQWRMQVLTEAFGPCGIGWNYEIEKLWIEQCGEEVLAFASITLTVAHHEGISGIGGSKMVVKESGGLYNNDEAYKMAVTDALSVAAKALGIGADIYMGRWDGSKYNDDDDGQSASAKYLNEAELKKIDDLIKSLKVDEKKFIKFMKAESTGNILKRDFGKALAALEAKRNRSEGEKKK